VAQWVERPTLDVSSGLDLRVVSLSPRWAPRWLWSLLKKQDKTNRCNGKHIRSGVMMCETANSLYERTCVYH